jgi:hypothetical protein
MVGARGFEPPTPDTPCQCATRLRHAPINIIKRWSNGTLEYWVFQRRTIFSMGLKPSFHYSIIPLFL